MKRKRLRVLITESLREIIFGLEDSLVSTLGAITGIAVGANNTYIVILSGLVLIAAESTSMAAGSYLSSKSAFEADQVLHKNDDQHTEHASRPIRAGAVMGFFYFIGGFVPLTPYFFLSIPNALIVSIPATAIVLFLVGVWSAQFTKRSPTRSGFEMVMVSLSAAFIGYIIARIVSWYFGINIVM